ncbi:POK11 protein, partial [Edolisoma coerulescens]|nr:POK11 protein [Edolisoma coerulescens]
DTPVWVVQWPLKGEKLTQAEKLVDEQLKLGHTVLSTSLWNTPIIVIPKKSGKWQQLQDLKAINRVIEPMGALQPGLPSPSMIPQDWPIVVISLKDCFFMIALHPEDCYHFTFSLPSVNCEAPMKRYHRIVLPQGMKNSLTIWQLFVANALEPVRQKFCNALIYRYMDDILIASQHQAELDTILSHMVPRLESSPEKVQKMARWKYLGWFVSEKSIHPQSLKLVLSVKTLHDLQKLLGTKNLVWTMLGITNDEMTPLFDLLKGDTDLLSAQTLTKERHLALERVADKISSYNAARYVEDLPVTLFV